MPFVASPMVAPLVAVASSAERKYADLDITATAWVGLLVVIAVMLAIDLFRHRDDHAPSRKEALAESVVWICCGLAFAGFVAVNYGGAAFSEYLSGYVIEKSLSIDNVFVWSMLFSAFAIPTHLQHRVLFWGIFGALAMRAAFIGLGSALITRFWWLLLLFGLFLVYTGVKIVKNRAHDSHSKASGMNLLRRVMPVTEELDGHRFFTRLNGRRAATPLFAALVVVEVTDLIFAVDSVPAILAVSREPYLVFASNAFAILGLRAMYFLLADAKERFYYLSHALGAILVFVGLKMAVSHWFHLDTNISLGVIALTLTAAVVASRKRSTASS